MLELKFTGERYTGAKDGWIRAEHMHRYAIAAEYASGKVILDIACGEGYGSFILSQSGEKVLGMDIDPKAIKFAANKYRRPQLKFKIGDIYETGLESAMFDLIVCFETIEHVEDTERAIIELKRILKPDGLLIMSTPEKTRYNKDRNSANFFHLKEVSLDEYEEILGRFFDQNYYMFQQSLAASLIFAPNANGMSGYYGDYLKMNSTNLSDYTYIISFSGNAMPVLPANSLYNDASLSKQNIIFKQSSKDYSLGNFLLFPLRILKSFLKL